MGNIETPDPDLRSSYLGITVLVTTVSNSLQAGSAYAKDPSYDRTSLEKTSSNQSTTPRDPAKLSPASNSTDDTMPETGKELVRRSIKEDGSHRSSLDSEAERRDQMIRQAPYLPQIQFWARKDGPYTLKIGHQWFHCDDLIINDQEYRQQRQSKASTRYQPQQISSRDNAPKSSSRPSRPQAGRTASQQMMQNAKSARDTEERRQRRDNEKLLAAAAASAPATRREPDYRRNNVSKSRDEDDYFRDRSRDKQPEQEGRNANQIEWVEPRRSNDSVTPADIPPKQSRPHMSRRISRRSTQDGGILVPVRSKGKRVRFAPNI